MSLMTRSRTEEVKSRAAKRARQAGDTLTDRIDRTDVADATAEARRRARELADDVSVRARETADKVEARVTSAADSAPEQIGRVIRFILRLVSRLPQLAAAVLGVTARILYRLGDRSAEIAEVPTPRTTERRRGRRKAVLWFVGGFAAGAASGYAASEIMNKGSEEEAPAAAGQVARFPDSETATG